ncbi:hypothetical protein PG985_011229 [Apiospora marii]|uniref:Uncharacterized protein n=1 Tax=Apiospora marii TaxID=335849 RepID=A0ABR1ST37_9PEZI
MSQLTQFHLFTKLPPELQNMIWAKYDDEVDPVIWHEFSYARCSLRRSRRHTIGNTTPDSLEDVQSYRVRRPDDDSRPDDEHKKKSISRTLAPLTGVDLPLHPRVRIDARGEPQCGDGRRPGPARFRARLDRDVFYFTHSGPAPKNFLGFLSPCAAGQDPPPLADDHWFFQTRKLAIGPSILKLGPFDQDTLRRHQGLTDIWVVASADLYKVKDRHWFWTHDGFANAGHTPNQAEKDFDESLWEIFGDRDVRPTIYFDREALRVPN